MIKELPQTQPAVNDIDLDFYRNTGLSEVIDKLNEVTTELNSLTKLVVGHYDTSVPWDEIRRNLNESNVARLNSKLSGEAE